MKACLAVLLSIFRVVVIPTQFQDAEFTYPADAFAPVLEKAGKYLDDQFRGLYEFHFDIAGTVTLSHTTDYYGANSPGIHDALIYEAAAEACRAVDNDMDFSVYDNDDDGKVDAVMLLTAGLSESDGAGENLIWPQHRHLSDRSATITLDGKEIDGFFTVTELKSDKGLNARMSGIGTVCHEFLHSMDMPDLYDTDGEQSGGLYSPPGRFICIMDEGNLNDDGNTPPNFSAFEMSLLELGQCDTLRTGSYTLEPLSRSDRYLWAPGGVKGEYFLFECRDNSGWDAGIGGQGMLITHVDRTEQAWNDKWLYNRLNSDPEHPCVRFVSAIPDPEQAAQLFFPQPGHNAFGSGTEPPFTFWNGRTSLLSIKDIKLSANGNITFQVIEPVNLDEIIVFQDAAMVSWKTNGIPSGSICILEWSADGEEPGTAEIRSGNSYTIEHLKPHTSYNLKISVVTPDKSTYTISAPFKTKTYISGINPYIYLRAEDRNENGTFKAGASIPLRVYNSVDASNTEWFFNNIPVPAASGHYTISGNGRLKAIVHHADGTVDIIIKDIVAE